MKRWLGLCLPSRLRPGRVLQRRRFHYDHDPNPRVESVEVVCASSGSITVDLHNVTRHPPSTPLVLYIPPFSPIPGTRPPVPRFLRPYPTAVINYRWSVPAPTRQSSSDADAERHDFTTPLQWPTPLHDTLAGYTWLLENLRPPDTARRDVYVYSSHAGASIATSLALTESHHHEPMAVRGLVAWNGIYNWSMFLPDHKVNKPSSARSKKLPPPPEEGSALHGLQTRIPELFRAPVDLLDPFASPSLFFQTAGMTAPSSFTRAAAMSSFIDKLSSVTAGVKPSDILDLVGGGSSAFPAPRRSALIFPPRKSTLKLPPTLLLHDSPPTETAACRTRRSGTSSSSLLSSLSSSSASPRRRRRKVAGHTFETQAAELAGLMRRSLEKLEFKTRMEWDEDFDEAAEAGRRVAVVDAGENEGLELGEQGQEAVREWLEDRIRL
ncbi:Putative alpha/Beta hydrolase [Colletotrichum destructivum]|uniref:Alpha/Beta hydrolase n=1 Tax=Colletotrichum destructivum TaxID=34406 RepID=A0AAX4IKR0_9PEZI|nr:Putative alpha/Beta hydrolase [Colletotrichum destructivum]